MNPASDWTVQLPGGERVAVSASNPIVALGLALHARGMASAVSRLSVAAAPSGAWVAHDASAGLRFVLWRQQRDGVCSRP